MIPIFLSLLLITTLSLSGCVTKYKAMPYWELTRNEYSFVYFGNERPSEPDYYILEPMKLRVPVYNYHEVLEESVQRKLTEIEFCLAQYESNPEYYKPILLDIVRTIPHDGIPEKLLDILAEDIQTDVELARITFQYILTIRQHRTTFKNVPRIIREGL